MQSKNWLGFRTLYKKEVRRFMRVYNQTIVAPMINALLFLSVFSLALGERVQYIGSVPFGEFMVAGLVMMTIVQNAFANTSSSLIMGKVIGHITDVQIPPLSPLALMSAMVLAGITRGVVSGMAVYAATAIFIPVGIDNMLLAIFFIFFASMMLALLGLLGGIFAESFDKMSAMNSYIITPLSFLSGTFYSVKNLPEFWQNLNNFNPFFYMIDGFRYSMLSQPDSPVGLAVGVLIVSNILLSIVIYKMLSSGYRLKQ